MQDSIERTNYLDAPLLAISKVNWERVLLVALILAAIVTRFWDLGYRSYNHDESIHTDWSWNLYTGRGYQHNPIYHGPLLYLATAFTFGLFGDNDVTGRVPNAVFGIVLVALPYFFRKWLGTRGALAASAMLLISPAVLYYSRFNRHDVYVSVFTLLIALVIWKYFEDRRDLWLYSAAALLSLSFTAMETTFIFLAVFAIFLCGHFTFEYLRLRVRWKETTLGLVAAVFGIPFFGIFVAVKFIRALFGRAATPDWYGIPSFNLAMVFGTFSLPLITPAFIYALNILWKPVFGAEFYPISGFTDATTINSIAQTQPDVVLRVLVLTFIVIFISALVGFWWNARVWIVGAILFWPIFVFFFTTAFTNGQGFFTGLLGSLGYWLSQQGVARGGQPSYYYVLVQLPLYEFLPYTVALATMFWYWWRYRPSQLVILLGWLFVIILFAIFYFGIPMDPSSLRALLVLSSGSLVEFTIFMIVALIVFAAIFLYSRRRGLRQLHLTTVWLFVAIGAVWLFSVIFYSMAYFEIPFDFSGLRRLFGPNPGAADQIIVLLIAMLIPLVFFTTYDSSDSKSAFPAFLFTWAVGNLMIFSWAGEKMPWLVTHLTIPLAFISGWAIEKLVNVDWRDLFSRGAAWVSLLILLTLVLLVSLLTTRPFQGLALDQLNATIGFLFSLLAFGFVAGAFYFLSRRFVQHEIARVVAVTLIALFAGLTVHSAWLAVYQNPDVAVETLIYAQGSPDVPVAMREIEELSRRLCAQTSPGKQTIQCDNGTIKVAYDDDSSWPFVWYLRNYRNAQFYGASPNAPFDAPVVIVGPKNEETVKTFLGTKYTKRAYKLIWWPLEGYKDLSLDRIWNYIVDPQQRADLFTAWFYHKYKENLSQWPYVHNFSFYVRKDVATLVWNYSAEIPPQPLVEDEYAKKQLQINAERTLGTQGVANGQLNNPKNIAIDARGNIYVADSDNGRIQKFDSSGKFLLAWGTRSPENVIGPRETFNQPWGIAVDKNGNLFVADTWNHRIQKFDSNGKFLTTWGENGDTRGVAQAEPSKFYGPRAVAIDPQGNLYVTDTGNKRVLKFSSDGAPLAQYGGLGTENGQFQEPVGIAVDAQGNVFVADTWNQRIQKFDKNFTFVMQWSVVAWDSQSVVNKPYLAVDPDGNVFITDPEGYRVIKFTNDGKLVSVFGQRGADTASFNLPTGLAFDAQGNLYVADSANNRILIFTKP